MLNGGVRILELERLLAVLVDQLAANDRPAASAVAAQIHAALTVLPASDRPAYLRERAERALFGARRQQYAVSTILRFLRGRDV